MAFVSNGTTILDAGAFSASLGSMVHIKTITASSSGTVSFVHGSSSVVFNNTYPIYCIKGIQIHPSASDELGFNGSTDAGSNYNVTKTTTHFYVIHAEDGTQGNMYYNSSEDIAQGTGFQNLTTASQIGTGNDCCATGELWIFNPSSTTFVKHFISRITGVTSADSAQDDYRNGYFNTTTAIDAIQFKMSTGNIDSGDICLYGIN